MALTDFGKDEAMDGPGVFGATRYISFHLTNDTELSGHGYARKSLTQSQADKSATDGVVTTPDNFECWTASDGSAQRPMKFALYSALTGGNQVFEPEDLDATIPAAPADGQAYQASLSFGP